ncbi:MAG: transcriptional repressor [Candidatus Azobacteroides sp.]|nr:transcriptional repressor [Candidatus Azobacteroides sp.]
MNTGEIIKKAGLKATLQRKTVYELMTRLGHSSIDEIIAGVRQQNPEVTISTVYRILDSFCKAGLLSKMNHPNGKYYYDITPSEHHHIFMNNEIIDYMDPELTALIKNHLKKKSFKYLDAINKVCVQISVNNEK